MRKLLSALFAVVLLATSAFANGRDGGRQGSMSLTDTATGLNVKTGLPMNGLLAYKNAMENDVANPKNLDYSVGSATNTLTVSRDSTHPATYFNGNGVMQVTTTSNVARRTRGYYDATGWHSAPGWLIEGASTNLIIRTDGTASGSGLWTGWTIGTGTLHATPTGTQVAVPELSGIASANAQRLVFTADATDSNESANIVSSTATADGTVVATETLAMSTWLKGSVIGGTIKLSVRCADAADTLIEVKQSSDIAASLSTSTWQRFFFTCVAPTGTRRITARFDVASIDDGDSIDIQIYGVQVEKQAYPSSFIPTTTTALTRNAETTNTYTTSGNFPAPSGGNCLSFDGQNASGDDYVSIANSETGNQWYGSTAYTREAWVFIRSDGEGDLGRIFDVNGKNFEFEVTSQSGSNVKLRGRIDTDETDWNCISSSADVSCNIWHHVLMVFDGSSLKLYVDGSRETTTDTAGTGSILDDSSNSKYIGNDATGARTFDGFIQSTRIYRNKALTPAEVATAYAAGRYASQPVAGCTAEYLFNEGTGTTLTDSVADNDGTISGATWSKDTHSGTIMLKYRPVMLPSEQSASWKSIFGMFIASGNSVVFQNDTNASNRVYFQVSSNSNNYYVYTSASTWARYDSHTIIATWSTTADAAGKKLNFYIDGVLAASNASFAVPAGVLPTSFSIQSSAGQAMILEEVAVLDRPLTQSEVTQIQNRS